MRSLAAYVLLCLLAHEAGAWLRDKLNAMKRLLPILTLLLVGTAQAQPSSLQELTSDEWASEGWQTYATAGGDSAWVYSDSLWYAKIDDEHYLHCSRIGAPTFTLWDFARSALDVVEGKEGYDMNSPLGLRYECIRTYAAVRHDEP